MKLKKILSHFILFLPILFSVFSLTSCNETNRNLRSYNLCEQLNDFIREIKIDGTLDEMQNVWFGSDETKKVIDRNLSGENGKITFASSLSSQPMGYYKDGLEAGLSTDIIFKFAKQYGYSLEFYDSSNTNSTIAAVLSGKADFGGTYLSITEERRKNGCFSDPYFDNKLMVVMSNETAASINSLDDLNGEPWGCCEGSTYTQYISEKMTNSSISEYMTEADAFNQLNAGRVKAIVLDKPVADYIINSGTFPNLCEYSQFFDYEDQYSFFFPKFVDQSLDAYSNKKIASVVGSMNDELVKNRLPNAEILFYDSPIDCCAALSFGKVDAYVEETGAYYYEKNNNPSNLYQLPESLGTFSYGVLFPKTNKGSADCADFNEFLATLRVSGKLALLSDKWTYHSDTAVCEVDYRNLEGNETLHVQTSATFPPFSYLKGEKLEGLEIEIATLYAQSRHKKIEFILNNFSGILSSANRADYDFALAQVTYTEERAEMYNISDSYYDFDVVLVTLVNGSSISFGQKILESFNSTFVKEQRWKILLNGFLETLKITVLSIIFGSIIGSLIFLLIYRSPSIVKKVLKVVDYIINGMPVVVLLMIVYYVVFAKSSISASAVAIGTFTVLFSSCVTRGFLISIGSINKNQFEGALALGYRKSKALFRFIIPQALPSFLKIYKDDAVNLLKATAVAGYIAIQDLTKASDIIRSRTYEAIFPLITLGLIYFLLAYLLAFIIKRMEFKVNPKRRKKIKILKGVSQDEIRN